MHYEKTFYRFLLIWWNFFYDIEKADRDEWFCTSDPIGSKLGSGGGTAWLLEACKQHIAPDKARLGP